ncbi:MAG: DUF4446 family protein [Lachnospiraceae bacterium]|jgi:hypothetical protein|nr:MAG: DUF4446 family protein [Lachnospiraceae bacterium]
MPMLNTMDIIYISIDVILLALLIYMIVRYRQLSNSYNFFMRGKRGENLEGTIFKITEEIKKLKFEDKENKDAIRVINKNLRAAYQKFGVVKYNAFKGMGGNLSFAFAMLDYTNTGYILNSVHSREGCFVYVKVVDRGQTEVLLGTEEKEALEQALGYIERPV